MAGNVHRILAKLQARDEASTTFRKVGTAVKAFGVVASAVGAYALGRTLVRGLSDAVTAAGKYEAQAARLKITLANQGANVNRASKDLLKYADNLQRVSNATEQQVLEAINLALNMGATAQQSKRLALASTELSAALGVSLEQTTRQLARTLGGYAGELGEIIPELKDFTQEQLKNGAAIEHVLARYKGYGEYIAGTFEGTLNNLNSAWEKLLQTVGGAFRDTITNALNDVAIPAINEMTASLQDSGRATDIVVWGMQQVAKVLVVALEGANYLQIGFRALETLFNQTGEVIARLNIEFLELAIAGAEAANVFGNYDGTIASFRRQLNDSKDAAAGFAINNKLIEESASAADLRIKSLIQSVEAFSNAVRPSAGSRATPSFGGSGVAGAGAVGGGGGLALPQLDFSFQTEELGFLQDGIVRVKDEAVAAQEAIVGMAEVASERTGQVAQVMASGLGNAFTSVLTGAQTLSQSIKSFASSAVSGLINLLVQMGVQRLATSAVVKGSEASEGAAELSTALAAVYANSFASVAAIPITGAFLAPAVAAANLAAATAGAAGAQAAGAGLGAAGAAGFAEGGVVGGYSPNRDTVPAMLSPGEMVLTPEVTDRLINGGGSGGRITIELRSDIKQTAVALNSAVRGGQVRLAATDTVSATRTRR